MDTHFFTNTQSRNTPLSLSPDVKVLIFRTKKMGVKPSNSAARVRTWFTPVLPKRYRTRSLRFSMRL